MYQKRYFKKSTYRRGSNYSSTRFSRGTYSAPAKRPEVKTHDTIGNMTYDASLDNVSVGLLDFTTKGAKIPGPQLGVSHTERIGQKIYGIGHSLKLTLESARRKGVDAETSSDVTYNAIGVQQRQHAGTHDKVGFDIGAQTGTAAMQEAIDESANGFVLSTDDDTGFDTKTWTQFKRPETTTVNTATAAATDNLLKTQNFKYIRTQHRVIVFKDRQERGEVNYVEPEDVLEPRMLNRNIAPSAMSNYNALNAGRFDILYDKVTETDSETPVKYLNLQRLKGYGSMRFNGVAANYGSIYIMLIATTGVGEGTETSSPKCTFQYRLRFTDV